ncbi:phage repressor protein CI [Salmonella enterica subsp. enterica]|nr:phage repressor protein CI [Salmonella enterica subsp. enterica serovar Chester]EBX4958590.1 phage repressor protein CI [Salmonella enterica subsp. enterica serovar Newport]EDH7914587.1 phage repressor protein CI [Salmonella enterica subsp. enterica serovar Stanley]EFU8737828.1 phage repressor protein CI [Salmonella enterica]EGZ3988816.1 phage repressor protein CI [Salmonella enterica subsp. enterica serovar Giza]
MRISRNGQYVDANFMEIDSGISNEHVLDRICEIYGFAQKIQLARHFNIAASSLQNRYTRGAISYDFIVHCSLETGASVEWLLTGKGEKLSSGNVKTSVESEELTVKSFTLSEGRLIEGADLRISKSFFTRTPNNPQCVLSDNAAHFIEPDALLSDGSWLVEIEGAKSIRELTVLPGKKLHVAGGKVPFECGVEEIRTLGRVLGVYSEVN